MHTHDGLSRAQERNLLEQALDAYQGEDADQPYPDDTAHEIVDAWLPVYYHRIREEWEDAGYPEPEDDTASGDIHALMNRALYETAWGYLYRFIGDTVTHGEAAQAIEEELGLTDQQRVDRAIKTIDQVLLGTNG